MSPVAFLDANVPIYAAGRPHPLKEPCASILLLSAEHPEAFVTNAEVLQELLHRYLSLRLWPQGGEVLRQFAELMQGRIEAVQGDDVLRAADMAYSYSDSDSRDLLHVAVMHRLGLRYIVSADAGFDQLPGIERLAPSEFGSWRSLIIV
ncbi:MAG: type II toxin-antitoxin system VapC family toxin [Chloroflexi bacterium]|nr:type II toxin-antitoxin system VapC family toxin [Chloroflexota bacterium]